MNLLTPAALKAAAKALRQSRQSREGNHKTPWKDVHPIIQAEWEEDAAAAFNAAIARLIEEGRAFDNFPGWENEIIIKKVMP